MAEDVGSTAGPDAVSDAAEEPLGTAGAVVAALDGSAADEPLVDWAADEAATIGAPLRLLSAVDPGLQLTPYEVIATGSPSLADHLEEGARHVLDRAVDRVRDRHPGLDVATVVPWGPPAAAIVRFSEGARRVVVGSPARGRLERFLTGSVALPVVAHAHCPVVVVPADTEVVPPRRIVVGVDGSESSSRAVEYALAAARANNSDVTVVLGWNLEVHEGVVVTEPSSARWAAVEKRYAERVHQVVDPLTEKYPDVRVVVHVRHGAPVRVVLEEAAEREAELVVVGSRGFGGFKGLLLGSVSRNIVQHAGRVVVVAR